MKSSLKKIIDWVKSRPVVLWIIKSLFALIVGAISFLVAKALFDVPTGVLLTIAIVYAYLGHQITNHSKVKNKELMISSRMSIVLALLSVAASILGFIFISKAFGWVSVVILAYSVIYLIARVIDKEEERAKKQEEIFSSMTE